MIITYCKKMKGRTNIKKCILWLLGIMFLTIILSVYSYHSLSDNLPTEAFTKQICESIKKRFGREAGYILFVDYSRSSCTNRLSIYDVDAEEYIHSGMVLHGNGRSSTASKPEFSNEIGSNCSSLGLFKVKEYGKMYRSNTPCFRLVGLDKTNNNALKRGILIHPCRMVTYLPIELPYINFPLTKACEGCFSVGDHTFITIRELAKEKKPMYVYSFYGF